MRQVGYVPELHEDAGSEKLYIIKNQKKKQKTVLFWNGQYLLKRWGNIKIHGITPRKGATFNIITNMFTHPNNDCLCVWKGGQVNAKVKFTLEQATKTKRGSNSIDLLFL